MIIKSLICAGAVLIFAFPATVAAQLGAEVFAGYRPPFKTAARQLRGAGVLSIVGICVFTLAAAL